MSLVASLALAGAGAGLNALGTYMSNRQSKSLMRYQNELYLQNWHLQNDYNDPKNQRARLEAAGYNPNVALGSVTAGNASSAPSVADAKLTPYTGIGDSAVQGYMQGVSMDVAKQNVKTSQSQSELNEQKALTEAKKRFNMDADRMYTESRQDLNDQLFRYNQQMNEYNIARMQRNLKWQDRQYEIAGQQLVMNDIAISNNNIMTGILDERLKQAKIDTSNWDARQKAQIRLALAQAAKAIADKERQVEDTQWLKDTHYSRGEVAHLAGTKAHSEHYAILNNYSSYIAALAAKVQHMPANEAFDFMFYGINQFTKSISPLVPAMPSHSTSVSQDFDF